MPTKTITPIDHTTIAKAGERVYFPAFILAEMFGALSKTTQMSPMRDALKTAHEALDRGLIPSALIPALALGHRTISEVLLDLAEVQADAAAAGETSDLGTIPDADLQAAAAELGRDGR